MADLAHLNSWYADWKGLRVAVLGLGVTGFAVADTLAELGAVVTVVDRAPDDERATILGVIGVELEVTDSDVPNAIEHADLVVTSPGLAPTHPWIVAAETRGIPIWGDIELAWRVRDKVHPAEWLFVTGTNGKTTTTQLAAHMIAAGGFRVAPVGNIGTPVLDAVRDPAGFDYLVVELSSFQLHYLGELSPYAAACLNIDDDHLDWHGGVVQYRWAKAKVYRHCKIAAIYNVQDTVTRDMVADADVVEGCRAIGFSLQTPGPSDFGIVDDVLVDRAFLEERHRSALEIGTLDDLRVAGLASGHMVQNVLAAAALARSIDVAPEQIRDAVRSFTLDSHRTELVATVDGVTFVDDSKATNPHAAHGSLSAFRSVVWIVGGLTKGVSLDELVRSHAHHLAGVVVIGREQDEIIATLERHASDVPRIAVDAGDTETVMQRAVDAAAQLASEGDTVLLAPAAASQDQFASYAERGDRFKSAVRERGGHDANARPESESDG